MRKSLDKSNFWRKCITCIFFTGYNNNKCKIMLSLKVFSYSEL